jgi:plasmid maintenance system antidote protein VapI
VVSGAPSDYKLARRLEVSPALISHLRIGRRPLPLIVAVKLAITLDIDPMEIIARTQLLEARDSGHRAFWRSFTQRAVMVAVTACTRAFGCFGSCMSGRGRAGGLTASEGVSYFA